MTESDKRSAEWIALERAIEQGESGLAKLRARLMEVKQAGTQNYNRLGCAGELRGLKLQIERITDDDYALMNGLKTIGIEETRQLRSTVSKLQDAMLRISFFIWKGP